MTSKVKFKRPDCDYFVPPSTKTFYQGDIFEKVVFGFPSPPEAVALHDGERRFISGPFDVGPAMLMTPTCNMAAQGEEGEPTTYAHPVRTLCPIVSLDHLRESGMVSDKNEGNFRADKLRPVFYLPPLDSNGEESAALLYMSITVHHDVIADHRIAQLGGEAFRHLRVKLMAYHGSYLIDHADLGPAPSFENREL